MRNLLGFPRSHLPIGFVAPLRERSWRQRSWPHRGGGATKRRHRREPIAAIPDQAPVDRRPERDGPALTRS